MAMPGTQHAPLNPQNQMRRAEQAELQGSQEATKTMLQFSPNGKYLACVAAAPSTSQESSGGPAVTHGGVQGPTQVHLMAS